jgi:hypothetical protein
MRSAFLLVLCLVSSQALSAPKKPPKIYSIPLPSRTDFSALDWLVGEWSGKTTEKSPPGEVHLSVAYDLDKRFLVFHEIVTLASTDYTPAVDESWMGVLSGPEGGKEFTLRAFSSTGFITRYRVTAQEAEIRFMPEGGEMPPPGWLFRRLVARLGEGELTETVEAAPPDGSFFPYYSARLRRQDSSSGHSAAAGDQKPK